MPNTVPAAGEGLPEFNRRSALALTGTGLIAALGGVAATACHPLPAVAGEPKPSAEPPAARVRRLGRELAAALDEYTAEDGSQWKAHVWPQSAFPTGPVWLENLSADVSAVMMLFREWEANYQAAAVGPEEACNSHMDRCREVERRMMAVPAITAADFAAKYIVASGYGDWIVEGDMMGEALRLAGSRHTRQFTSQEA